VGVAYGSPVETVAQLLLGAITDQKEVKEKPAPSVVFEDFGDNSLVFDTYFWCDVGGEKMLREIRSEIRFRISQRFAANGIEIAFPQRDVHLDSREPLSVQVIQPQDKAK
jgi:small-conductance mechanosensitive channel